MTDGDARQWRDFLDALDALTAMAKGDVEAAAAARERSSPGPCWRPAFAVELLAASRPEGVELPETEFLSESAELAVRIAISDFELRVTLQLQGFAALEEYAGREARLVSDNGAIDYRLRFSPLGAAVCALANKPAVREGLRSFKVLVSPAAEDAEPQDAETAR
jgi:hypothetical protein